MNETLENQDKTPFFSKTGMIIFGIVLILLGVFMTTMGIMCDDYYWHITVGEWILEHKEIPTTGIFSWSASDTPWFAHEWLSEIILYGFSLLGVGFGGWLYYAICITIMFSMIYFMNIKEINKNYMFGLGAWIFLIMGTLKVASARPHAMGVLFFIYLLYSLEQFKKNENSKFIYFTPIVTILWANIHGGSIMFIPILFLIYILSGFVNFEFMKMEFKKLSKKQMLTLLVLFVVNMLAICINPNGVELITYPFSYSNVATMYVNEWRSPSLKEDTLVILMIIAICVVLFLTEKKLNFTDLGVLGTMMLMTLLYVRFEWWLIISAMFIIFKYVPEYGTKTFKPLKIVSLSMMALAVFCILGTTYKFELQEPMVSEEAIQVIQETEHDNLYNIYDTGNILIYNGIDVFLDGRSDMYQHKTSLNIYQDKNDPDYDPEMTISILEEGMEFVYYNLLDMDAFVDRYQLDLFLISKYSRCRFYLESREDTELIYEDDYSRIYKIVSEK